MKTLNRTLSLVLVLVMVLGMFGIAGAAFTDAKDVKYNEAVDVMSAIGVIDGMNGAFNPKGNLTREQAAKIVCYLTMGKTAADKLTATAAPFKDVNADRWSAGSIAYCVQQGIISGRGDGTFDPTANVTGYEFAKMLLVVLGYDATIEQFTGPSWTINVAKRAFQNDISVGNDAYNGNAPATREEATLYALNTIQAGLVTYATKGTNITLPDGTTVNTGASAPSQTAGNTFMKSYYPNLKVTPGTDSFGRAARIWTLKGVEIGTYAKSGSVIITEEQDADDLAKLLKGYIIKSGATYSVNGATGISITSSATADASGNKAVDSNTFAQLAPLTGNGVKVEVFVDSSNIKLITGISVIKTDLAQVKNVNTTAKSVSLAIVSTGGIKSAGVPFTVKASDNEALYESLKVLPLDTPVLVTLNTADNGTNYSVASVAIPTVVTGKVTATTIASGSVNGMTVNGTAYKAAAAKTAAVATAQADTKNDATVLLDSFGYIVHYKGIAATATHAYVLDTYQVLSNGRITDMAKVALNDGTIVDVAAGTSVTRGVTYKVTATTPAYTFVEETTQTKTVSAAIKATDKDISGNYFASDVKFIFVNTTAKTATVKDGVQNVPTYGTGSTYILGPASASDPTLVIKAVYIVNGATAETSSVVYFKSGTSNGSMTVKAADGTDVALPTYDGYIDGELVKKMPIAVLPTSGTISNFEFYTCIKNENGSYSLSNTAYAGAAPGAVAVKNESVSSIAVNRYVTISGAVTLDLTNAVFVDFRTLGAGEVKVDSLYAFNAQLATKALDVDILYNGANRSAAVVFVRTSGVAHGTITVGTVTDQTVANNTSAALTVTASASNSETLSYQWYKCDDASKTNPVTVGTNSATYNTVGTTTAGDTYYYCVVSAPGCASVTSNVAKVTTES